MKRRNFIKGLLGAVAAAPLAYLGWKGRDRLLPYQQTMWDAHQGLLRRGKVIMIQTRWHKDDLFMHHYSEHSFHCLKCGKTMEDVENRADYVCKGWTNQYHQIPRHGKSKMASEKFLIDTLT